MENAEKARCNSPIDTITIPFGEFVLLLRDRECLNMLKALFDSGAASYTLEPVLKCFLANKEAAAPESESNE